MMGLLKAEERAARQRVEVLREQPDRLLAELRESETDWHELVSPSSGLAGSWTGGHQDDPAGPTAEPAGPAAGEVEAPVAGRQSGSAAVVAASSARRSGASLSVLRRVLSSRPPSRSRTPALPSPPSPAISSTIRCISLSTG